MGPASVRTEGGVAARGNDFVLVAGDGRAEMATAWARGPLALAQGFTSGRNMMRSRAWRALRHLVSAALQPIIPIAKAIGRQNDFAPDVVFNAGSECVRCGESSVIVIGGNDEPRQ